MEDKLFKLIQVLGHLSIAQLRVDAARSDSEESQKESVVQLDQEKEKENRMSCALALEAEETRATLAAALALVDDCDAPECRSLKAADWETRASARAKRCDSRKRHRIEILRLRDQVVDLEAHLTQLRRYCGNGAIVAASPAAKRTRVSGSRDVGVQLEKTASLGARALSHVWFKRAVAEFKSLQRSKQRNLDLKDAIEEQRSVSAALEQLFQLKLSQQDLDFLSEIAKQNAENGAATESDPPPSQFTDMLMHLEKLYAGTAEIISHISTRRNLTRIFHNSHSERDPVLGLSHEFTTNTPLTCGLRDLEHFLWQQIRVSARIECRKPCQHFRQAPKVSLRYIIYARMRALPNPTLDVSFPVVVLWVCKAKQVLDSCETHVSVEFNEAVGGRSMDGTFVIRKFVEPHRVVLTLSARITFSESTLVIREDGWVVMNGQGSSSSANTLVQTHYRIFVEKQDSSMAQDMKRLKEFIVHFLSEKMKSKTLQMQNLMLQIQDSVGVAEIQHELSLECIACAFNATST